MIIGRLASLFRRPQPADEVIEGYEHPELVDVVFRKTVAFQPTEPWTEVQEARTVLDFGGACGLHYKMAKMPEVRWAVVETPAMVARASQLQTDRLRFFTDIGSAAIWLSNIDVMHCNGALQYTPEPLAVLRELCALGARTMLWKRMRLSDRMSTAMQKSRLIDNGHGNIDGILDKTVSYRETVVPEQLFLECHAQYRLEERTEDSFRFTT